MGRQTEEQANVSAKLGKYLTNLASGAKVTTSDVGALIDKITPNDQGLAFYKAYTDCLKQQAAILLNQRGVTLVPPSEADLEERKDEQLRQQISEINPSVPKARLVQLLGEPISSGSNEMTEMYGLTADLYQYKHMLFVTDYYKAGRRIGLVIATRDPVLGAAMFPEQIRGVTLGEAAGICEGAVFTTRENARTNVCPASHATDFIKKIYFFDLVGKTGSSEDSSQACHDASLGIGTMNRASPNPGALVSLYARLIINGTATGASPARARRNARRREPPALRHSRAARISITPHQSAHSMKKLSDPVPHMPPQSDGRTQRAANTKATT